MYTCVLSACIHSYKKEKDGKRNNEREVSAEQPVKERWKEGVTKYEREQGGGGFVDESERESGVPVTWEECRAAHLNDSVIRSAVDTHKEDVLSAAVL